jgi:hypothetical protein
MFPVPRNQYEDKVAFIATKVGQHTLGVSIPARKGAAHSLLAEICRTSPNQLSKDEREECPGILADEGEAAESLFILRLATAHLPPRPLRGF